MTEKILTALRTDNQFIAHRVPVKQHLKHGDNLLWIVFASAFQKGRDLQKRHGKLNLWNGDPSRLYVRKAGYKYVLTAPPVSFQDSKEYTPAMDGIGVPCS